MLTADERKQLLRQVTAERFAPVPEAERFARVPPPPGSHLAEWRQAVVEASTRNRTTPELGAARREVLYADTRAYIHAASEAS